MSFDDESTPTLSGRRSPTVERRLGRRSRSVFRSRRPWRRRTGILLYVAAFAVAGSAFVATVADIADNPTSPPPSEVPTPQMDQPVDDPHDELDPH